jgi:hypothetical protein
MKDGERQKNDALPRIVSCPEWLLAGTYNYLDMTVLGRQEDWEEPRGRSDGPFMHWLRHHDRYEHSSAGPAACCGTEEK